jgi:hypothetical protein
VPRAYARARGGVRGGESGLGGCVLFASSLTVTVAVAVFEVLSFLLSSLTNTAVSVFEGLSFCFPL